jgi:hypothetical protein
VNVESGPEQLVRDVLAREAERAPRAPGLAAAVRQRAHRQRRRHAVVGGAGLGVAGVIVAAGVAGGLNAPGGIPENSGGSPGTRAGTGAPLPPLTTNDWRPGQGGMQALLQGVLRVTADGCLYSEILGASTPRMALVWPAGYTARRTLTGEIVVLDSAGTRVLTVGDRFAVGGGAGHPPHLEPCRPDGTDVGSFEMNDTPTRVSSDRVR